MPKYEVEIRESGRRTYIVEAPSIHHVKAMYDRDEDELGKPVDSEIFSNEMAVTDDTGHTIDEGDIEELVHLGDDNGDPLCGEAAGDEWQTTPEGQDVNCPLCMQKMEEA